MKENEYFKLFALLVRQKYTVKQEILLLKQQRENSAEYQEYVRYVEECKEKAKRLLASP